MQTVLFTDTTFLSSQYQVFCLSTTGMGKGASAAFVSAQYSATLTRRHSRTVPVRSVFFLPVASKVPFVVFGVPHKHDSQQAQCGIAYSHRRQTRPVQVA